MINNKNEKRKKYITKKNINSLAKSRTWTICKESGLLDMLQYFEKILSAVESLCSLLQDGVYFMGGGAA